MEVSDLKVDTSFKGILALTIPISFSKLIPELNYLFNAIFLGHLGTKELAVVGITGVYYLIFSALGYGLNNAVITIMSRRAGSGKKDEIISYLIHGLLVSIVLAIFFIGITLLTIDPLLHYSGIDLEESIMSSSYIKIRIWGLFPLFTFQMFSGYLITLGKTKLLVIATLVASLTNIFFDYSLIFGHYGFDSYGFNGAAYASILSEIVGVLSLVLLTFSNKFISITMIKNAVSFSQAKTNLIIKQGFPLMAQYGISTLSWWIFFVLISRNCDQESQALSQSMRNLFGLSGVFSWAFGSATNTIISNLIGQQKEEEVIKTIWKILSISFTGMLILVCILNIFPNAFLSLYGQPITFIEKAYEPLRIVTIAMLILCIGVVWLNAVVATGKNKIVLSIEFVGRAIYLVYVYYVIEVYKLGVNAAWMSEWAYWSALLMLSVWYMKSNRWKGNTI